MLTQLNSAGCMNKGFILDGYPKSKEDAKSIFFDRIPIESNEEPVEGEEPEQKYDERLNERILPQYTIVLEADDAHLTQKMKDMPAEKIEGTHWNDAGMARRLKDYRAKNPEGSGETIQDLFTELLGYPAVLVVDATIPEADQIGKMEELIEQKGKPCCINMISDDDRKFL